jgi:hypothetical protein
MIEKRKRRNKKETTKVVLPHKYDNVNTISHTYKPSKIL